MTFMRSIEQNEKLADDGAVTSFPGRLSNAENLCITNSGRLFVTGGETVAEIMKTPDGRFEQIAVPIRTDGVPEHCMANGIAAHGDHLYLACARIHRGNNPFLPGVLCDVNRVEQTGTGLMLTYLAALACSVESYIIRATLGSGPLEFTHLVAKLPGKFLANGLAVDATGEFLYVANSAPALSAGIYRVPTMAVVGETSATLWCRPDCTPNGVQVRPDAVYFTGNTLMPMMSAVLGRIPINTEDGSAGAPREIYTSLFSLFDDFDMVDNGFVIAHFADYKRVHWPPRYGTGVLRFCDKHGRPRGSVECDEIDHPSAVTVARKNTTLFKSGDIVITDKGYGRVAVFQPDQGLRAWLRGKPTSAAITKT